MNFRVIIFGALILSALTVFSVLAQQPDPTPTPKPTPPASASSIASTDAADWSFSFIEGLRSEYLVPGLLVGPYRRRVVTSDIALARKKGRVEVSAGVSDVQGFNCGWCSDGEEVDPFGAIAIDLRGRYRLDFRYTHLVLGRNSRSDYANPSITLSRLHDLSPTLTAKIFQKADAYFRTNKYGGRSGVILSVGGDLEKVLSKSWKAGLHAEVGADPYGAGGFKGNTLLYRDDIYLSVTKWQYTFAVIGTFAGTNEAERPGRGYLGLTVSRTFAWRK